MQKDMHTISEVSRGFGVSTRMLRYYEGEGLLESRRLPGYAYRVYDETAIRRLRQILLLRRLRIPVRQIRTVLESPDAVTAMEVFDANVRSLNTEIEALSTIRDLLTRLIVALRMSTGLTLEHLLTGDETLLSAIDALAVVSINFKQDRTMEKLSEANQALSKLKDVRIVTVPEMPVAACHIIGEEPEARTAEMLGRFIRESGLLDAKPDFRHFGFNHPNPTDENTPHGYERWVTIPEDFIVPAPMVKKRMPGGLYAVHMISFGNFNEWDALIDWINASEQYVFAGDFADQAHMCGLLEEHLNSIEVFGGEQVSMNDLQLDLMAPVRRK